jgi:hypothetical protein
MANTLSVAITAHVKRTEHVLGYMLPRLVEQASKLSGVTVEALFDDPQTPLGCWGNTRRAFLKTSAARSTHVLVLQDDIRFCGDFLEAALRISKMPKAYSPVSFFWPRKSVGEAMVEGVPWVRATRFLWGQANMLPAYLAQQMVEWLDSMEDSELAHDPANPWRFHSDVRMAAYFAFRRLRTWVAVPSLVEHVGHEIGGSTLAHPRRLATAYIGDDGVANSVDWENPNYIIEK